MTLVLTPVDTLPDYPEIGSDVMQGSRAAAVAMSEAAEAMHKNAAPAGWDGDEATLAHHALTSTARKLDGSVAALEVGIAALDKFSDTVVGRLAPRHGDLERTRTSLVSEGWVLLPRLGRADDPTIEADVTRHNSAVAAYNSAVATWARDLGDAEDTVIASLKRADTVREGSGLVSEVPDVAALVREVEALAKDPEAIFAWWSALSRSQREALKARRPDLLGNLDGIPLTDRDEANRANLTALRDSIAEREGTDNMTDRDRDDLEKIKGVEKGLKRSDGTGVPTYLVVFDPRGATGDGHAAIAYGNPETADHVSVNVPGLTSEMKNFNGVSGDAWSIYDATDRQHKGSVASIAWLGYDAPSGGGLDVLDFSGVTGEGKASDGAKNLSTFVDGLHATRSGDASDMHLTVIGHSYGSSTVAIAAGDGMRADDIVLVGSPGAGDGNSHASDLTGNVYVGASDEDPVSRLGNPTPVGLGVDPATSGFGAHRFGVDDGHGFSLTPLGLKNGLDNHTGYFDPQSDSFDDIVNVTAGQGGKVDDIGGRSAVSDPAWWARQAAGAPLDYSTLPLTALGQYTEPYVDDALGAGRDAAGHVKDGVENVGHFVSGLNPLRNLPGILR